MENGTPVWIEIPARSTDKLKTFYSALFPDWTFRPNDIQEGDQKVERFTLPTGLTGGLVEMPKGLSASQQKLGDGFTVYYAVESIDETEKRIHELGGKTVMEKTAEGESGWFINMTDPEGNRFGLYEGRE